MDERTSWDEPEIDLDSDDDENDEPVAGIWGDLNPAPTRSAPTVDAVERFKDRLKRGARERQGRADE